MNIYIYNYKCNYVYTYKYIDSMYIDRSDISPLPWMKNPWSQRQDPPNLGRNMTHHEALLRQERESLQVAGGGSSQHPQPKVVQESQLHLSNVHGTSVG